MHISELAKSITAHRPDRRLVALAVPCVILTAYLLGGEIWLLLTSLLLPLPLLLRPAGQRSAARAPGRDGLTGFLVAAAFAPAAEERLCGHRRRGLATAVFQVELDGFSTLRTRHGDSAAEAVLKASARRLSAALRSTDIIARAGDARFAVCLDPVSRLDAETCLQLAGRLQARLEQPVALQTVSIHPTASIGYCLSAQLSRATGPSLAEAAQMALEDARIAGPSSVRAYRARLRRRAAARRRSDDEACQALEKGQIHAWFQPQVSTVSGRVTGFEALARWHHPERGIVPPAGFLEALQKAGQLERLAGRMLFQALGAFKEWQRGGWNVPLIGVNFSGDELHDPALVDKIRWELDRFSVQPGCFAVEVLESVIAGTPNDIVVRNVNGLAALGCHIDLDDFGTGHSSIASIRRFHVARLKIDRSYVTRVDQDLDQQRMVSAIITMARQLGLDTLAEGVETAGEQAMLRQLGCTHVQGYGIGRPMAFEDTFAWMRAHGAKRSAKRETLSRSG
ncbi:putative bifunctional diguanylate cyclase/phosphodiesterase [Shimia sp.]|uniref:putative bifunctional diguanylate cyclase/phosphodiesterase n=1 Tax=Shimia sp. TaxID=1954381 RepID=UPI0035621110